MARAPRGAARSRQAEHSLARVVAALRDLYAYTYSVPAEEVTQAADLRARAMDISDGWVEDGSLPGDPRLGQERALLVRSYASLLAAVHR